MGKKLYVNRERCPKNHRCPAIRVCPVGALSQTGFDAPVVDERRCVACGKCARFCPMGALEMRSDPE